MTNGRQIGANFERNVASLLHEEMGLKFKRDLDQYRESLHGDLICEEIDFPFVIECKRRAKGTTYAREWWEQAKAAAEATPRRKKFPVLIYQLMRSPIRCVVDLNVVIDVVGGEKFRHENLVEMSIPTFCLLAREMLDEGTVKFDKVGKED